jgi:succinoglycan biosynthesis protein ExoA
LFLCAVVVLVRPDAAPCIGSIEREIIRTEMHPRVSVVIPALNEARYIEACLESVFAQRVDCGLEVIVVDGCSEDGTAALARAAGARVIQNPHRSIPSALNLGLHAATGDVLIRFDAHAEMLPRYVESCVRALEEESGAVNVGGWCEVRGSGPWGRALGAALASPLGVGNPQIWRPPRTGDRRREAETVPFGCFPVEAIKAAGEWCERLPANEDFELNHRLRRRGGRILFDPAIRSIYRPRENLADVVHQYWRYGRAKAIVLAAAPESIRLRQLAPLALLTTVATAPFVRSARAAVGLYASVICVSATRSNGGWRTAPVLAAMHLAWSAGVTFAFPGALLQRVWRP